MSSYEYLEVIIDEIQQEIIRQRGKPNIGKEGCLRRLRKLMKIMDGENKNKLSSELSDAVSKEKQEVYGLTENTARRLMYIVNSKKIIDCEKVNLNLMIGARETLDIAIEKQEGVIKNEV